MTYVIFSGETAEQVRDVNQGGRVASPGALVLAVVILAAKVRSQESWYSGLYATKNVTPFLKASLMDLCWTVLIQ